MTTRRTETEVGGAVEGVGLESDSAASATGPVVAQVYVDVGLPHLDRPFDYEIPSDLVGLVQPGVRVKVRFAGRAADGWVVGTAATTDQARLTPLTRLVSPEPVVPLESARLFRAVADHAGGTFCDVARLGVPPRHATTEKAARRARAPAAPVAAVPSNLDLYPTGPGYLAALGAGGSPRAAWTVVPVAGPAGDWADGLAAAAAATVASGRSAVLVVPDVQDCERLMVAVSARVDPTLVVRQTADLGPAARYRGFLRALRGEARVVVGTRAAAYTPVADLGLLALWDDGDDLHSDPHAPYPHVRDVIALRAALAKAAVLMAASARTTEVQAWVESGWLAGLELPTPQRRRLAPRTVIAGQGDRAGAHDPALGSTRLPHDVFAVVRSALGLGPVLVQVPHAGYRRHLRCTRCGESVRCRACGGPLNEPTQVAVRALVCGWCGQLTLDWACPACQGRRYRAGTIGSARTAEELARSFAETTVVRSDREHRLITVPDEAALVVATPGAEPVAPGGYAAAILLDAERMLSRASLRAGEESLRRWLHVTSLVRPAESGGTAILVGPPEERAIQAWLRLDPVGYATRELAERRAAGLPPAVRMAVIRGEATAVDEVAAAVAAGAHPWLDTLGPVPEAGEPGHAQLLLRCPTARGRDLAGLVHALAAARSAAKAVGVVNYRLDPLDLT